MAASTQVVRFSPYRLAPATPSVKWVAPAPLWGGVSGISSSPWLAEFQDDGFVQDFIALMSSQTPGNLQQYGPTDSNPDGSWKLYQPLHKRYYLITGSLVCRQYSLPDHTVARKSGEKTSFVLRRLINDSVYGLIECGWMKNNDGAGSWQQVTDKFGNYNQLTVSSSEERQPLHPVKADVSTIPLASTQAAVGRPGPEQRTVYYGYIPVASREKYLTPAQPTDIQQAIQDNGGDLRLEDVQSRILDQWQGLFTSQMQTLLHNAPDQAAIVSVYLLIDLADFLKTNLPNVFNAIKTNQQLSGSPNQQALLNELGKIIVNNSADGKVSVAHALHKLVSQGYLDDGNNAALGQSDPPHGQGNPPAETYDLTGVNGAAGGILAGLFSQALAEGGTQVQVPSEIADVFKVEPTGGDIYFIRLIYERSGCPAVVSDPSASFTFAKTIDPDAPARHIRIEMPSVRPQDLRKFKRGVGIQTSPELANLMNSLSDPKGILNGNGITLGTPGLGMICSFSIQIMFIIAFILMFIFLILLNIVFWWMAFFKICFPIPKGK